LIPKKKEGKKNSDTSEGTARKRKDTIKRGLFGGKRRRKKRKIRSNQKTCMPQSRRAEEVIKLAK